MVVLGIMVCPLGKIRDLQGGQIIVVFHLIILRIIV